MPHDHLLNQTDLLLTQILEKLTAMATTQAQLDAGLATLTTAVTNLTAAINQFVTDYAAKTGVDLTSELGTVSAAATALQSSLSAITTADPSA